MKEKYILVGLYNEAVEVSKEIYEAYYQEQERWKNLWKKDRYHQLESYNNLDTDSYLGESLIKDETTSVEEMVMARLEAEQLRKCIELLNDKYNILHLISIGYTEEEIAKRCGVSRLTIHKMKKRLLKRLRGMIK